MPASVANVLNLFYARGMGENGSIRARFPGPWRVEETHGGHFQIVSASGASLAYVYVGNPVLNWDALTVAEARAIALAIAALSSCRQHPKNDAD